MNGCFGKLHQNCVGDQTVFDWHVVLGHIAWQCGGLLLQMEWHGLSSCVSLCYKCEPCKNDLADCDLWGSKEPCIRWARIPPTSRGIFRWMYGDIYNRWYTHCNSRVGNTQCSLLATITVATCFWFWIGSGYPKIGLKKIMTLKNQIFFRFKSDF